MGKWLLVNVGIPALAPAVWALIIWIIERIKDHQAEMHIKDAYTDGQLGFVSMGWCASTLLDMDKYEECARHLVSWGGLTGVLWIIIFFSGLMAAGGARWSVASRLAELAAAQPPKPRPNRFWLYLAGWSSLGLAVVSLPCMLYVYFIVNAAGAPKC